MKEHEIIYNVEQYKIRGQHKLRGCTVFFNW